jgi:hypothetical protein
VLDSQLRKAETDRDIAIDKQLAAQAAQQRAEELNKKWDEREAKVIDNFNFLYFLVTVNSQDIEAQLIVQLLHSCLSCKL